MQRRFLLGLTAIVALAAALLLAVWRLTASEGPPAAATAPPPAVAEAPPTPAPPEPAPAPEAPPARQVGRRGRVTSDLFTALQPLGIGVTRCLRALAPAGGKAPGKLVLVLDLEPRDGEVAVTQAMPLLPGDGSEALASCLQAELIGKVVAVDKTKAGRPYKMSFSIQR